MPLKYLGDGNPDGVVIGSGNTSIDKVGFYAAAPVYQRSTPMQALIQGFALGSMLAYNANVGTLGNANTATTNELAIAIPPVLATDFIIAASRGAGTNSTGSGICNVRANASNGGILITACNPTGANVVFTNNEVWSVATVRGMNVVSQQWAPANVPPNTTIEQILTLSATVPIATAVISGGQVTQIQVTSYGSGYTTPPTVVITPPNPPSAVTPGVTAYAEETGTMAGLPGAQGGIGATAVAVLNAGSVVGVLITNPGSGYTTAPSVSFIGGNTISPGMAVQVNKPSANAGIGIGNVRVVGNNQIGVTFFNVTSTAVTPSNETYQVYAFNEMPAASPIIYCSSNVAANWANTSANALNTANIAIPGLTATDQVVNISANVGMATSIMYPGLCAANNANFFYCGVGNTASILTAGVYTLGIVRQAALPVATQFSVTLAPTVCTNSTSGEQQFTLPANLLVAGTPVLVNKQSYTAGVAIVGARANAANQLTLNYLIPGTANIIPPTETYIVTNFPAPLPSITANVTAWSQCTQAVGITLNQAIDLQNEIQQTLVSMGIMKGS